MIQRRWSCFASVLAGIVAGLLVAGVVAAEVVVQSVNEAVVALPDSQAAALAGSPVAGRSGFDFTALGQLFAGLVLVLVLFLGLAWLVKRSGVAGGFSQPGLKVLATLPLSTRERVVLVQAGPKQLLLGVAPGRVTLLESFDEPLLEESADRSPPFSHWLQRAVMKSQAGEVAADKGLNDKPAKGAGNAGE